jgi:hypothetical protein
MSDELFKFVDDATKIDTPHAWIQWKGTDVCMDVRCTCGARMHVDAEFAYHLGCPHCDRTYAVGAYVKLVELTDPKHVEYARTNCFIDMEPDESFKAG